MSNTEAYTKTGFVSIRPIPPLRLGIIGCGGILRKIYCNILSDLRELAAVVALCDLSSENLAQARRLLPNARGYLSISELFSEEKLDAVMVLCSESANSKVCKEVLAAGIPVYLEKPPALTLEEFDDLRDAEDRSSAPLFVAYNRRHAPLYQEMDWPDGPYQVVGQMLRLGRSVSDFPYTALHLIDTLLYYSHASPSEVEITFRREPVANWQVNCRLDHDSSATLEVVPDCNSHREHLMVTAQDTTLDIHFPNPESPYAEGRITVTDGDGHHERAGEKGLSADEQMGYLATLKGFLEHVLAGKPPPASYRLSSCRFGIELMDEMMHAYKAELTAR